jgi:hypothetical protein
MAMAQPKMIRGVVKDAFNNEAISFASLQFKITGAGKLADSSGAFRFFFDNWPHDTLIVTSVGYADFKAAITPPPGDTLNLIIAMVPGKFNVEAVVRAKVNRGLQMWKRIVKNKPRNDRYRFQNFSYELYNKLELDLNNVRREKVANIGLIKKFGFILDNIDTSEESPFLPLYITEAVSHYYYQKQPLKRREVFKAIKTVGIDNESIRKFLGGTDQVVNIYNNYIAVFDKTFISPISDNGDAYYNYKVADTQYLAGRKLIHFLFTPKHKGQNTFEGDCWVQDSTWAIQKMNLRLGKEANVNFLNKLNLIQEYKLINDSTWFLAKDKFVVDIAPLGNEKLSFIGRKTTTYEDIVINDSSVINELSRNKIMEEILVPEEAAAVSDTAWQGLRHEALSNTEASIYKMIDTLTNLPSFQRLTKTLDFIGTGYATVGKFQIGPWQNWIYSNAIEGLRLRFDVNTNGKFSKKIQLHGYAAYGFGDQKWKGEFDAFYLLNKNPRMYLYASYLNDFDYGQNYYDEISSDNIFALAIRKKDVPIKYIKLQEERFDFFNEWNTGFSILTSLRHRQYDPVQNLPGKAFFEKASGIPLAGFEASIRLRYAYLERFLEKTFYRTSLGSPYPIVELKYTKGLSGVFESSYDYSKLSAGISNTSKIPPLGNIYFNLFGGKTFGAAPYMYLDVAPGNEIHYYNKYAFNLMNRYEYIHDSYVGLNLEHNFGAGIFRFVPLTRKLKFRQFWTAKALWGNLSDENKTLNFVQGAPFKSLDGKTYAEIGTGIDNIFRVLRIDFLWKVLPAESLNNTEMRFGVFGSFRFSF